MDVSPALRMLRDKGDKGCGVQSWRGILVDEGDMQREGSRSLEKCLRRHKGALEVKYRGVIVEIDGNGCPETWGEEQDRFPLIADVLEYF